MEVVFYIAETITAENEPASLVFAGLKNERVKETNPRKGTETAIFLMTVKKFFILKMEKKLIPVRGRKQKSL